MTQVGEHLGRLAGLHLELGVAEARALAVRAGVAVAVAFVALVAVVSALVALLAAALAPAFGAAWQHLALAGAGTIVLAGLAGVWSARRLRGLGIPMQAVMALEETRQWLGALLKSRLTSR